MKSQGKTALTANSTIKINTFGSMRMVYCSLLMVLCFSIQAQDSLKNETDRIYWNDWYRLEWNDFQGGHDSLGNLAAVSKIALPYTYSSDGEGSLVVKVDVCFLKKESWVNHRKKNQVLLQHEQLHFDIAELHRRMVVKALSEEAFDKNNYKEKLDEIIDRIWLKSYRKMQDKYDAETNFSRIFRSQITWNKYVSQQLRNLEDYTFNEVEISLITFD